LSDDYFDVPISTFEPTKRESNVEAVNIVPGEDVTYFDCRILPRYDVEEVLADIQNILEAFGRKTGASITIEILQKQVAPKLVDGNPEIASRSKKRGDLTLMSEDSGEGPALHSSGRLEFRRWCGVLLTKLPISITNTQRSKPWLLIRRCSLCSQ
jgi:hypothetical protein